MLRLIFIASVRFSKEMPSTICKPKTYLNYTFTSSLSRLFVKSKTDIYTLFICNRVINHITLLADISWHPYRSIFLLKPLGNAHLGFGCS